VYDLYLLNVYVVHSTRGAIIEEILLMEETLEDFFAGCDVEEDSEDE